MVHQLFWFVIASVIAGIIVYTITQSNILTPVTDKINESKQSIEQQTISKLQVK